MSADRKRKWDQAGEADSDQGPAAKVSSGDVGGNDAAEQAGRKAEIQGFLVRALRLKNNMFLIFFYIHSCGCCPTEC